MSQQNLSTVNAVGTVIIAVLTLAFCFGLLLVAVWAKDTTVFTAIVALVGPISGAVVGHYFGMRAMAQGASVQAQLQPGSTVS